MFKGEWLKNSFKIRVKGAPKKGVYICSYVLRKSQVDASVRVLIAPLDLKLDATVNYGSQ